MSAMLIQCECGHRVQAEDEPALLAAAHEHIAAQHPDLVASLSDEDLRRMARQQ
jgi:hypothetical protein